MTPRLVKALLVAHGVVTFAAAVVLAAFPAAIPATVGIALEPDGFLLAYFLAAAELAIALLSVGAARLADPAAVRLVLVVFVVFHLATAVLELASLAVAPLSPALAANIVVRLVVAALFLLALRAVRRR